ncbi:toll/interleukin-1 receptor domain-containing protein [Comamonas sp. J-3]|uniref:toll/interleukin-1 receptor domain-containing protein n=1 Tax=Comamonas trifloxystrobinivorans TaxID=3350256 RepID=UPI003728EECC
MTSIFLSHNSQDKPFVRRLARDLDVHGVKCWIDEAEIKVGDSLIEKIRQGLDSMSYVAVVLSPDSVNSAWVQKEIDVAMNQEILGKQVKVLPLLYRKCELPGFLLGKKYADFTNDESYEVALEDFVRSIGVVFRRSVLRRPEQGQHIGRALDKAWASGLPVLSSPFHRPFQYIGLTIDAAAKAVGGIPNEVGNIILESEECRLVLEAEGNFINYVDIELKRTAPHQQSEEFDSEIILGALSINPAELELVKKAVHYHHYSDHRRKLKVSVSCLYDGAPLSVGFGGKYYGM